MTQHVCLSARNPEPEQQGGNEQPVAEGKDGLHQGAAAGAGSRIRPPQLLDEAQEIRDRREPGSHRETSTSQTLPPQLLLPPQRLLPKAETQIHYSRVYICNGTEVL